MKLQRVEWPNGIVCPGCDRLESLPVRVVIGDENHGEPFSVDVCDTCLRKLHTLLDEAKGEKWGVGAVEMIGPY